VGRVPLDRSDLSARHPSVRLPTRNCLAGCSWSVSHSCIRADGSFGIWTDEVEAIRRQSHSHGQAGISADGNKSQRTLLSPAESVNSLTIGAAHAGSGFTGNLPDGRYDPFTDEDLPSIVSAMGLGFRKVVKPELLFAGGRAPVRIGVSGERIEIAPVLAGLPG
jgi:hypothetical protein